MSLGTYVLYFLAYGVMYSLPYVFFRREGGSLRRFNLMWCVTALPYAFGPVILTLAVAGKVGSLAAGKPIEPWLDAIAVPFAAASIALQLATMAIHRIPLALWHQKNDAPEQIVTWGPYGRVRHPFYVAFLLLVVGTAIAFPHWSTFGCAVGAFVVLSFTARREERRLLASHLGAEYAAYLERTGRFFPRLRAADA